MTTVSLHVVEAYNNILGFEGIKLEKLEFCQVEPSGVKWTSVLQSESEMCRVSLLWLKWK